MENKEPKKSFYQKRMEICQLCEHITDKKTCKICGCFLPLKTKIRSFGCPIDKWPPKYG